MPVRPALADRPRFVGIFIVALVVLAYQVLMTRIFSVTMYYHFAFAGISLAMLGMTIGAEKVYLKAQRFAPERFIEEWSKAALGFGNSCVLLIVWFLCAPLILPAGLVMAVLSCSMLLFIIPFTYSGICVTLILTQSEQVGKLYAADLIGAALGCIGIVALLFFLDPVTILFLLGALCAYAAWYMARGRLPRYERRGKIMMTLFLLAAVVQGALCLSNYAHLGVFWAKGAKQQNLLYERWNTFSRIRVIPWPQSDPFGWGFGRPQTDKHLEQKYIDIDADAGTIISKFDGKDLTPFSFLAADVINMAYSLRPVEAVDVIGVGGGRDVMSALYFGAKSIFAIELNPSIAEVLKDKFADFAGHVLDRPEVHFVNAEARSWIAQHHPKVDLVQISLIDTWAATAAGGLTLTENRLYTLEAWREFLGTLNPKGMLEVSRWYEPKTYRGEFYRLLSLAVDSLESMGVAAGDAHNHIFAFYVNQIVTVVLSPTGFSPAEVASAHRLADEKGFEMLVGPDVATDAIARTIVSGAATKEYYDSLPMDVASSTDNRPFFFYTTRIGKVWSDRVVGSAHVVSTNVALLSVSILLIGTIIATLGFVIQPLVNVLGKLPLKDVLADLCYFAGIGLGFMLIEISQMQRLMVFLGHPVFGLSVVLFTLLLFGGIGSATVHSDVRPERLWKRPLLLCIVLTCIGLATPAVTAAFVTYGTIARILISVVLLAPAGLFMGMMFPTGMILSQRYRELQPWFWGINGSVSVFASILGMALSMLYGINAAYWTGVAAYLVCLAVAWKSGRRTT